MCPAQFCTQCVQNVLITETASKTHHVRQIPLGPTLAVFCGELVGQPGEYLLAILGPFTLQQLTLNTLPHLPVKQGQFDIHSHRRPLPGGVNQAADLGEQRSRRGGQLFCAAHDCFLPPHTRFSHPEKSSI